jgi:site-specific DNA recombinase
MFVNEHKSYYKIAKNLNNRGIPSKTNSYWCGSAIKYILTNCNFIGYVRYGIRDEKRYFETRGVHEPIISEELFYKAQKLIKNFATKVYKKHPKIDNYFAGIAFCSLCGSKMISHGDYKKDETGKYISPAGYRCPNKKHNKCTASDSRQTKVEQAFIEYINDINNFDTLDEIQLAMKQEIKIQNLELINNLKKQLEKLERREKEITDKYVQENIDFESYSNIKKTIDKERHETTVLMESIEEFVDEELTIKKENIIKDLKENWHYLNKTEKRQFIINFIDKIEIVNEREKGKREGIVKVTNVEFSKT